MLAASAGLPEKDTQLGLGVSGWILRPFQDQLTTAGRGLR